MPNRMSARIMELTASRVPFAHATVVRAQVPTSACTGDDAIILEDGSIEGFVGGQCAENSVRTAALSALSRGDSVLLRVLPEGDIDFPESPGAQVVVNPCLSGGALEIFIEPMLPPPRLEVVGHTPIADAVVAIADVLGYVTSRAMPATAPDRAAAVIIASHGRDEEASIRAALEAGAPHIALVASRRRGLALLDELGLTDAERARIRTPAGLSIGARTAPEIALSIVADVVTQLRNGELAVGDPEAVEPITGKATAIKPTGPTTAIDPVCGMTVTVMPDTPRLEVGDTTYWFCGSGCRDAYARDQ